MQIRQIRYFLAVCAEGTFTRAARRCGVAQPSLTQALLRLESELGGALFKRGRKGSQLTELGALVHRHMAEIARVEDLAKRSAAEFAERQRHATQRKMESQRDSNEQALVRDDRSDSADWRRDVHPRRRPDSNVTPEDSQSVRNGYRSAALDA